MKLNIRKYAYHLRFIHANDVAKLNFCVFLQEYLKNLIYSLVIEKLYSLNYKNEGEM